MDWLEVLCRVSVLKALPTDEEIQQAECADAATYLRLLEEEDGDRYEELLAERASAWGAEPRLQPVNRCVAHVVSLLCREVETETAGKDDLHVTQREAKAWAKKVGLSV